MSDCAYIVWTLRGIGVPNLSWLACIMWSPRFFISKGPPCGATSMMGRGRSNWGSIFTICSYVTTASPNSDDECLNTNFFYSQTKLSLSDYILKMS